MECVDGCVDVLLLALSYWLVLYRNAEPIDAVHGRVCPPFYERLRESASIPWPPRIVFDANTTLEGCLNFPFHLSIPPLHFNIHKHGHFGDRSS